MPSMTLPRRRSAAWSGYFRAQYRLIRLLDPLVRVTWRAWGLGNVVELRVPGRRTGRPRPILLGLLRAEGRWFLGHPNGDTAWTRNLDASPDAELVLRWPSPVAVHAERLADGPIRESAVMATGQHVFPGNLIYRLARPHVRAAGAYFEIKLR